MRACAGTSTFQAPLMRACAGTGTVGPAPRLADGFEDDDRDRARRLLLVVGEAGPDLGHEFVQAVVLVAARNRPGAGLEMLRPGSFGNLDLDDRVRLQVAVPLRVLGSAVLVGRHPVVVVLA